MVEFLTGLFPAIKGIQIKQHIVEGEYVTTFGTREKLPTPTHQKLTNNPALASEVRRLTTTRHRRRG